jgi:hypothetical protein
MTGDIERHRRMIDSSGMGLLPGIGLAFLLCMLVMAALLLETWWAVGMVLAFLFAATGAIVWVFLWMMDDGPGSESR